MNSSLTLVLIVVVGSMTACSAISRPRRQVGNYGGTYGNPANYGIGGGNYGGNYGGGGGSGGGGGWPNDGSYPGGDSGAIPGIPGRDYPTLGPHPPLTGFQCRQQLYQPGYYADTQAQCQVFHICEPGGKDSVFLCPNGTLFNQHYFVCDWWYNVNCNEAPALYSLNGNLYRVPGGGGGGAYGGRAPAQGFGGQQGGFGGQQGSFGGQQGGFGGQQGGFGGTQGGFGGAQGGFGGAQGGYGARTGGGYGSRPANYY